MKTQILAKLGVFAGLVALFVGSVYAGSWSNQLMSPFGGTVTFNYGLSVPSAAYVQQGVQVFNSETTGVNQGPLAYIVANYSMGMQYTSGTVPAGTYSVYQAIVRGAGLQPASGVSFTTFQW